MPELDDEVLFGDGADNDERDDDFDWSRDGEGDGGDGEREDDSDDDDADEGDEDDADLEGMFDREKDDDAKGKRSGGGGGSGKGKPGGDAGKGTEKGGGKTVTLTAKEYRALQERAREKEVEEAYWRGKAESAGGRKGGDRQPDDGDGEDDDGEEPVRRTSAKKFEGESTDDFINDINKRGLNAIKDRGFLTAEEVQEMVRKEAAKIARGEVKQATSALHSDAQIYREYPDLQDPKSEFSKAVMAEIRELVGVDKSLAKSSGTIAAAAKIVKTRMDAEARAKKDVARDRDRERRIAKQTPSGGGRRVSSGDDGEGGGGRYMSPLERQMLAPMLKGLGVSEKAYIAERRKLARGNR